MSEAFLSESGGCLPTEEAEAMIQEAARQQVSGVPSEPFFGKRVMMLDDSVNVIRMFHPLLIRLVGEAGAAEVIHYQEGTYKPNDVVNALRDAVLVLAPDIVLVDYELDPANNGAEVVAAIKAVCDDVICVGFSSDSSRQREFLRAGADTATVKNFRRPVLTLRDLASRLQAVKLKRKRRPQLKVVE